MARNGLKKIAMRRKSIAAFGEECVPPFKIPKMKSKTPTFEHVTTNGCGQNGTNGTEGIR